jgi:uncharacterized delta-60 repeat protein
MVEKYLRVIVVGVIVLCAWVSVSAEGVYEAWVARYNGPGNFYDAARAVLGGTDGGIYVTGSVNYVSGTADYMTIKYGPDGDTIWTRSYDWAGDEDVAYLLAKDADGNIIVAGAAWYPETRDDIAIIKYSPSGDIIWMRLYNGSASALDQPSGVTTDKSGNIYVSGVCNWEIGSTGDCLLIKYSPDGDTLWTRLYDGSGNSYDAAYAVAVDTLGYIYVAGTSRGVGTSYDYLTIKYNPDGGTEWVRKYNSEGSGWDIAHGLAVDTGRNVYVTGTSGTIKYSTYGDSLWYSPFEEQAQVIATDGSGNVYVSGWDSRIATDLDFRTVKYSPDGNTLWVRYYNGSANREDLPFDIAVDVNGNAYVTGWSTDSATGLDYLTIKYSPLGELLWQKRYNGPANGRDEALSLFLVNNGDLFVTGGSSGDGSDFDFATVKYSPCFGRLSGYLNNDERSDIVDLVYLVNILFKSWSIPGPTCLADVNGDSLVSMADIIYLANHVFKRGPAPIKAGPCCD